MSFIDPVTEDIAQFLITELEAKACSDSGIKLKKITRDRDMLSHMIHILPDLKFKGLVVLSPGPINKNTVVRLGYA